jgi:hypothetical protein
LIFPSFFIILTTCITSVDKSNDAVVRYILSFYLISAFRCNMLQREHVS